MSTPTISIERPDDEHLEIHVNGEVVASANYDGHGWSGMDAVERTAIAVARACGVDIASDPYDPAEVNQFLDDAAREFAAADTSSERVEAMRDLLAGWYERWPSSAVTDPHEPIAHQIVSMVYAAEARAGERADPPEVAR